MSFLFRSTQAVPAPVQSLTNVQAERVATNEEARPLPWAAGTVRLSLTWITPAINPQAIPITTTYQSGKNSTSTATVGYTYQAGLAGAICSGPVDALHAIYIDTVKVWEGPLTAVAGQFAFITLPNYGQARFYWGSDSQLADSLLEPLGHPAYRGQCYVVFDPLIFGRDRTSAPQVEFVVTRRTVIPGYANPDLSGDVCPIHAAIELATHPRYGLGIYLSDFDGSGEETSAKLVEADMGISPLINNAQSLPQSLAEILGYFDGFLYQKNGKYRFGSASLQVDFTNALIIDTADQTDFPEIDSDAFSQVSSETRLVYTDRDREFKESVAIHHDAAAHALNGTQEPVTFQQRWITRQSVANSQVAKGGRRAALPEVGGKVMVHYSKGIGLNPGDPIRLRPFPQANYLLNCRVTGIAHRRSDDAELELQFVLDVANQVSGVTPAPYTPPEQPTYDADPMPFEAMFILPAELSGVVEPEVALAHLGAREHSLITGYNVFHSADDLSYAFLSQARFFAVTGTLTADLLEDGVDAVIDAHAVDRATLATQTPEQADADTVLMFLGDEILSVEGYVVGADGTATLTNLRRGRFGTLAVDYEIGERAFLIRREHLHVLRKDAFVQSSTHYFKSTSYTIAKEQDIAIAPVLLLEIPEPEPPVDSEPEE
ncbi:hypothetical protein H5P28_00750 [Ruficoccus amylovorans]|uniref:Tip attachment protein J domain-containing protein n=1 Tax=Ruficoccus amylovorans TaxID=1804625 RepID=A0A842H9H9_9BACT|nr:hypothetical protein [Ruficoccus amylovorans]MBC2592779.1 hypothetical protein [Ruficoccus amylovorans]